MRRRILPLVLAALVAALLPATGASGETSFSFYGAGYGHGLGMSQWGAYGLAKDGWTADRILTHFYTGTEIATAPLAEPLRVGLANGKTSLRLSAVDGDLPLAVDGATVATVPAGQTWTVLPAGALGFEVRDAAGATVVGPVGSTTSPLVATPVAPARVRLLETNRQYGRGSLEIGLQCVRSCTVRAVLSIGIEEYVYGVAEVPGTWPTEALAAQAIAARTYVTYKALVSQHRSGCDCAVYATTADLVYAGYDRELAVGASRWMAAVDATAGQVVTYAGAPIQAFFMSSSGGYTEDNEVLWGGQEIPYLRGVCDPGDYVPENPHASWTVVRSAEDVTARLNLNIGTVTGFEVVSRGVSGRILSVTVTGDAGSATIGGATFQSRLGLKDDRVWIGKNLLVTGDVRAKYDALECAPGQATTPQTTVAGGLRQKFERGTIFQGPGLGAFALSGPVLDFYLSKKGPRGELGFPTSDVRTLSNGATRARFEGGVVTCKPAGTPCRIGTGTATA
ncbi:MAG: SpoIID/LytB domain-containing protein [Actinomycetota bacterium]